MTVTGFIPTPSFPLTSAAPYTYRDALTYVKQFEIFRQKINELIASDDAQTTAYSTIADAVNVSINSALELLAGMEDTYGELLVDMQAQLTNQLADVEILVTSLGTAIQDAETANQIATTLANDFASAVEGFQDDLAAIQLSVSSLMTANIADVNAALSSKMDINSVLIDVADYGAVGDGITDDTTAIQAAIDAGGYGAVIFIPAKPHLVSSTLTLKANQTLSGASMNRRGLSGGASQDGGSRLIAAVAFTGVLIACEGGVSFDSLRIDGPGSGTSATAVQQILGSSFSARNVFIRNFAVGWHLKDIYYVNLDHITVWECGTAILFEHCYNVSIFNVRISAIKVDGSVATGIRMTNQSEIHMFGGAIEGYGVGIHMDGAYQLLDMNGVYFEQGVGTPGYSIGVFMAGVGCTINASGCLVWLNNHRSWIYVPAAYGVRLNASGNYFKWANNPSTIGIFAYEWENPNTGGLRVILSGDNWERVPKVDTTKYCPTILPGMSRVIMPYGAIRDGGINDEVEVHTMRTVVQGLANWTQIPNNRNIAMPSMPRGEAWAGALVWDDDARMIKVWDGASWCDSMGNVVG